MKTKFSKFNKLESILKSYSSKLILLSFKLKLIDSFDKV